PANLFLGLEVLLEIHDSSELAYITPDIDMAGINNRNLKTFHTDVEISFRLAEELPEDVLLVSESGISDPETVKKLRIAGYRGFLIGETFMKTESPGDTLKDFITRLNTLQ
ncbi:Indole-3-glycerol phosphate synthase, partial [termite gut metagenome]